MNFWALLTLILCPSIGISQPFQIRVVDENTSRGIPLVILETSLNTRYVTDSNGLAAIDDPLVMGHDVFFRPVSDGYSFRAPALAMGGAVLKPDTGGSVTLVMQREMIAERMYRITGAGIYRDSVALGRNTPIAEPILNSGVVGQDSALCTAFGGRQFWVWGDTCRMGHPLAANFRTTCGFSDLPTSGGLPVEQGIDLHYISKDDFVKPMMPMRGEKGSQVYWLSCVMTVPDAAGKEHLLAWWSRIENPNMKTVERGIAEYDAQAQEFKYLAEYPTSASLQPGGHAVRVRGEKSNRDYIVFTGDDAQTRVATNYEAAKNPEAYEALTCLENDGPFSTATAHIRRDSAGHAVYAWRKGAAPTGAKEQRELLEAGLLKPDECIFRPVDAKTGKTILPHACSIGWSGLRKKWTMILSELMGSSMLGETWYLEADSPEGPWVNAVKIVTHDKYTFYNPLQHPEMVSSDSRYLYFEGTYTKTFSSAQVATPYYDYNQIMYRLDLNDRRLKMKSGQAEGAIVIDR